MDEAIRQRYSRQILFAGVGESGQERLLTASAVVAGCGAIGAAAANLLVRAGVGRVRVVDRDFVEASNLQRQTLFEEADARDALPKAIAAERRLGAVNSQVHIEGIVADINPKNVEELLGGFDLILDGTDNFETRFLVNDFAVKQSVPWIYAAAVGSYGLTMTVRPGVTACLACLLAGERDGAGMDETCDTVGVLGPIVNLVASMEVAEALKLLSGHAEALNQRLVSYDVWSGKFQSMRVARDTECPVCVRGEFAHLEGEAQPHITMCGRDSVQIHERGRALDLDALKR
ncbi:MAG TPA: ThiF family adenylyltransferase, partial [Candidatus Sulfotelmatobacter sp.]|nr:ThiF family adenylyltransferase [Candidatus Sulfotelmatobacter sp.]